MSKKDYVKLAGALHRGYRYAALTVPDDTEPNDAELAIDQAAYAIADALAADDPRFDRERFLAAARGGHQ